MLGMAPGPDVIDSFINLILGICCVWPCLVLGVTCLIYKFAYKSSKLTPPASDNAENPKD